MAQGSTDARGTADDTAARWREEAVRQPQRMTNFAALTLTPMPPVVGATPREEVYRKRAARLYRYASPRTRRYPLLFVPNLRLSRPYIFDLTPGLSFDFFLLDWGTFGPEDRDISMAVSSTSMRWWTPSANCPSPWCRPG